MGKIKQLCTSSKLQSALVPYSQDRPGKREKKKICNGMKLFCF